MLVFIKCINYILNQNRRLQSTPIANSLSLNLHSLVTPTFSLLKFVPRNAARLPALVINDDITNIHNYYATYPSVVYSETSGKFDETVDQI